MAKKSTHKGTCQVCHRVQMLPGGLLAKHGYTVDGGFFSGVCFGAGNLPLEQSCELVKQDIERCDAHVVLLSSRIESVSKSNDATCYIHAFMRGRGFGFYYWPKVELSLVDDQIVGVDDEGKTHSIPGYQIKYTKEVRVASKILNKKYVEDSLEVDKRKILKHIEGQKLVVKNWVLKDLIEA